MSVNCPISEADSAIVKKYVESFDGRPNFRVAMFGQHGIGKSTIITRLNMNATIAEGAIDSTASSQFDLVTNIANKYMRAEGEVLSPKWSATDYPEDIPSSYTAARHCEACFLVYDVSDRASLEAVRWYHRQFLLERSLERRPKRCGHSCSSRDYCPPRPPYRGLIFVMANKIDGPRAVTREEGKELCNALGAVCLEMSAKTGDGVGPELLRRLVSRILLRRVQNSKGEGETVNYEGQRGANPAELKIEEDKNSKFWY